MFKQIVTYSESEINGVLNFRIKDISYYYVSKGSEFAVLLMKGSAVYYTVKYEDLKQIINEGTIS